MTIPMPWHDEEYEDERITEATPYSDGHGYSLNFDSMGFGLCERYGDAPPHGIVPRVGDVARLWGKGFGYPVRGLALWDGREWRVAYYRTPDEQREYDRRQVEQMRAERRERFERERAQLDAEYDALPRVFQQRIDRFRENNPDFRWEYEGYEVFCCREAVKIADALGSEDAIQAWRDLPYAEQRKRVPIDDGHSGNTFGAACMLAALYLREGGRYVPQMHGALSPLVGSEAYGDLPNTGADATP